MPGGNSQEWPVSSADMDAIADAALDEEPMDACSFNDEGAGLKTGYARNIAKAKERSGRLATIPTVRNILSDRRKRAFLQTLAEHGNVTLAAAAAGWHISIPKSIRRSDKAFAGKWDTALENAAGLLEAEAYRRAVHGTEKGVYGSLGKDQPSGLIGTEIVYSDTLLLALLKHRAGFGKEEQLAGAKGGVLAIPTSPTSALNPANWGSAAKSGQAKYRENTGEES